MDGAAGIQTAIEVLSQRFGDRLTTNPSVRERHGTDESYHEPMAPDAVAFPETSAEVAEIVRICRDHRTPVIPFGVGTSLEGHIAALHGGVCVDLGRMDAILRVNADDLDVTVEPGVTRKQLNSHLRDTGLFFPIDPGADATLGGMAATRASGTNAVRYGTMRDNVLALGVVLADGRMIRTGTRARKSSAGYDLTRLFIGSEGTLGIIVEVTLRLYGIPETISVATCTYPTVDHAVRDRHSNDPGRRAGRPNRTRRRDADAGVEQLFRPRLSRAPDAVLRVPWFRFGRRRTDRERARDQRRVGRRRLSWASKPEDRNRLWQARHDAHYANMQLRPGARAWPTDVCVPISRLAECISETRRDIEKAGLLAPIVGHVGDGNFHVDMVLDPGDAEEVSRARTLNERLVARALEMEGTCTGEHGVGYGKIDDLGVEHGEAVDLMRSLKTALDPLNLMNPGKVVRV